MRSRLVVVIAVMVAVAALGVTIGRLGTASSSRPPAAHAELKQSLASYLGVFETGTPPAFQPVTAFAVAAGKRPNLVGYYSGWAQPFDIAFARSALRRKVIPFVQIDPTAASISGIADGAYDEYLRSYAGSVRDFGHNVVIGFGHEMNAPWYPWGYRHVRPAIFVAAWRHLVTLFRDEGAQNVTWLWTLQADGPLTGPVAAWWPGAPYVTWVGVDGYYYRPADTFASVFGRTIRQVRAITRKPVLLSETAVGPAAGQFTKIQDLFHGMATYKTLGLVWFDKVQRGGIYHQDWRIEDNPAAASSFRLGVKDTLARVLPR